MPNSTAVEKLPDGRHYWTVDIDETQVGVADEWTINLIPMVRTVTLVMQSWNIDAAGGAATTIQPAIGVAAGFDVPGTADDIDFRTQQAAAQASLNADYSTVRVAGIENGQIFIQPIPDAADGTVTGTLLFVEGIVY